MRQDLQVRLLQTRMAELDDTEAQLTRELGEQRRQFAERTDISRIIPRISDRGLVPPHERQILTLTTPPVAPTSERSLQAAVLDFLSGADPVLAARRQATPPPPRTDPEDDGR